MSSRGPFPAHFIEQGGALRRFPLGFGRELRGVGRVGLQTVGDCVLSFNAEAPKGLIAGKAPGDPPKLDDAQRSALSRIIESGPVPAIHGVMRWQL